MPVAIICIYAQRDNQPMFLEEILDILKPIKNQLKRMDNRPYFAELSKGIQSSLNLKKAWYKDFQGRHIINVENAEAYIRELR
jgi:hypothetical protein